MTERGFKNRGNSCYLAASFQLLLSSSLAGLSKTAPTGTSRNRRQALAQCLGRGRNLSAFLKALPEPFERGVQEDAYELLSLGVFPCLSDAESLPFQLREI